MTIVDKAILVTGANLGIEQTLVAEAPSKGPKRVYARTHRPLAHPEGPVTLLTPDLTSAAQTARSHAGSDSCMPPATLTKRSHPTSCTPSFFSSTAASSATRLVSTPIAVRRAVP